MSFLGDCVVTLIVPVKAHHDTRCWAPLYRGYHLWTAGDIDKRGSLSGPDQIVHDLAVDLHGGQAASPGQALVLAGSRGWMDDEVFATLRELNLGHRVFLPGYIPQADLPALYSAASVFVYASRYEGFGLPVLEAMACGAPVITSNVASMPEIAGESGILIDPNDESGLADAMGRVLTDDELRARLARAGLERAQSFSWERAAQATLAVYERVARAD